MTKKKATAPKRKIPIGITAAIIAALSVIVGAFVTPITQFILEKSNSRTSVSESPTPNTAALYITQELEFLPISLLSDGRIVFDVGQSVTATMRIKNIGNDQAMIEGLDVAVRGPNACIQAWSDGVFDFPSFKMTLSPNDEYVYQQTRTFNTPGIYFAEPTAKLISGSWSGIPPFRRIYFFVRDPNTGAVPNPIGCITPVPTPQVQITNTP